MDCTQSVHTRQALPPSCLSTAVDVTVLGVGPAGALLAYLLVRRGLKVVLVEKARLPRVKPCGGGLNWKGVLFGTRCAGKGWCSFPLSGGRFCQLASKHVAFGDHYEPAIGHVETLPVVS